MKDNPRHQVEILDLPKPPEGHAKTLMEHSREIVEWYPDNMDGYFVIAWDEKGHYSIGCRNDANGIPPRLCPAWIAEVVRESMVTKNIAEEVVEDMVEWRED